MNSAELRSYAGRVVELAYLANAALCIILLGSTSAPPFLVMCGWMAIVGLVAGLLRALQTERRPYFILAMALIFFLLLYSAWQATGSGPATGDVRMAALTIVYPLVAYAAGLLICRSRHRAQTWIEWFGIFGAIAGLIGYIQFRFFPNVFLFGVKRFYLDSVTGFFVNRNTAATFLGLALLIQIFCGYKRIREAIGTYMRRGKDYEAALFMQVCFYGACIAVTLIALMLTKSRGGIVATGVGLVFLIPYLAVERYRSEIGRLTVWRSSAVFAAAAGVTLLIFSIFSGRVIYRILRQGMDDGRFCVAPAIWRASLEKWLTGYGFGSFPAVFPQIRNPECGIGGVWNRAHNFFLEAFFTGGLPVVACILLVLVVLLHLIVRTVGQGGGRSPYAALGFACLLLLATHSLVDFSLQIPGLAIYAALIFSAITVISTEPRRKALPKPARKSRRTPSEQAHENSIDIADMNRYRGEA